MFLEVLQFVFSSFWVWLGSAVLLGIVTEGMSRLFTSLAIIFQRARS